MSGITRAQVVEWLSSQSVLEITALVTELEEKWGVKASSGGGGGMMMAMAAPAAAPVEAAPKVEQTEFDVILKAAGANKINVIKVVREITALGLKEAKDVVDGAPKPIKQAIPKAEADEIAKKLKDAGADVEVK